MAPETTTVDIDRVYELAKNTRDAADTIEAQTPLTGGNRPEDDAPGSLVARSLGDSALALDSAVVYHAQRLDHFADVAKRSANSFQATEDNNRDRFGG